VNDRNEVLAWLEARKGAEHVAEVAGWTLEAIGDSRHDKRLEIQDPLAIALARARRLSIRRERPNMPSCRHATRG
jgi:hypothetical protein